MTLKMIPVYQPYLGAVGDGISLLSNFDPEQPWELAGSNLSDRRILIVSCKYLKRTISAIFFTSVAMIRRILPIKFPNLPRAKATPCG